ncbi:MAG: hypothetical protein KA419_01255 [Acidobacteria bacterium]|nr:hypothetical protein [Acidobacteriota bacterium]
MRVRIMIVLVLTSLAWTAVHAQEVQTLTFPRTKTAADGSQVILYQPQIDKLDFSDRLEYRLAVEIRPPGATAAIPASLKMSAATSTDLSDRTVLISDQKIVSVNFPSADGDTARRLSQLLEGIVSVKPLKLSLDQILACSVSAEPTPDVAPPPEKPAPPVRVIAVPPDPPVILCSQTPSVLVLFDGEPVFAPIKDTGLRYALNTNWDLFQTDDKTTCYLLDDGAWLQAPAPTGPWAPAGKLPRGFWDIPKTDSWSEVHKSLPGKTLARDKMPRVYVSFKPAELILLEGKPKLKDIKGTGLRWVTNTESELFQEKASKAWFFLVAGRWYRAASLEGPWVLASNRLPADFAKIPKDHPRASVRASVPGTPEAKEAVMLAQAPHKAEVKRADVKVEVVYSGEPEFKPIEGTSLAYAVNTPYDVIQLGQRYYVCYQAVWFTASSPKGPWVVADSVPKEIYTIPPENPKYNVTYVTVYESTPETVTVGYTAGYMGCYVAYGCVVYGTGYYYPPYWYYPAGFYYPIYYPYPYTFGVAAYYNPYTGMYGRGAFAYGPYGGCGYAAAYNPVTGTYARGAAAYGPYGSGGFVQAYNPRTGTGAATYQRSTPYAQWGQSVVTRGDDWVRTGHYSDSRGTAAGFETSSGAKGGRVVTDNGRTTVVKDADNNVYAGHDGNVYKKTEDGWQKYEDGSWNDVDRSEARANKSGDERSNRSGDARASNRAGTQPSGSGERSRNVDQLNRDQRARSESVQRQKQYDSWRRSGGQRSWGGGRSFGGRRR